MLPSMLTRTLLSAAAAVLVLSVPAGAERRGEPSAVVEAAHAFKAHVLKELRLRPSASHGTSESCSGTKPNRFRCEITVSGGGLPAPCNVRALVLRIKPEVFRFDTFSESKSCHAQQG
jgi:hypothetical protein